ncbi:MAG: ABC transporter substrate-binding protein [Ilumatobacteraceae bacterium]
MMHRSARTTKVLALAAVASLVVAACGSDDDGGDDAAATTPPATEAPDDAGDGGDGDDAGDDDAGDAGDDTGDSGDGAVPDDVDRDATLRVVGANAPQQLDPVRETSPCSESMLGLMYDRLVRITPDAALVPGLAESWSAPDPQTFELTLREGVEFQDGTPFDAEAVAAHLQRAKDLDGSVLAGNLSWVTEVEAVDERTVRLTLAEERAGLLPFLLSGRTGMVPSPTAVESEGDTYGSTSGTGAGPYEHVENTPNDYIQLQRWDGYWQPEVQLVADVEHFGFNSSFQVDRLQSGELNYVTIFDNQFPDVEAAGDDVESVVTPAPQFGELFINFGAEPFDDVLVRQALNHAVDRDLMAEIVTGGAGTAAWGPLPEYTAFHNPDIVGLYPYDPDRARELLAEAGYEDGLTITAAFVGNPYYQVSAEALQPMLAESGINLEIESVPPAEINNALYVRQDYDAAVTAFLAPEEPGLALELKFGATGANNPSQTVTPGLDDLLSEGASEADPDARAAIYQEAEMLVMEEALSVPLYRNAGVSVFDPAVGNIERGYTTCMLGDFITPPVYVTED